MEVGGAGLADALAEFEAHWIGQEVEGDQYQPAEIAFFRDIVAGVLQRPGRDRPRARRRAWPRAGR